MGQGGFGGYCKLAGVRPPHRSACQLQITLIAQAFAGRVLSSKAEAPSDSVTIANSRKNMAFILVGPKGSAKHM
jgi:hypothetical protein